MREYNEYGHGVSLEDFVIDKLNREKLDAEAYSSEDRSLAREFFSYYGIDTTKTPDLTSKTKFEIMTPEEIGLLSPRIRTGRIRTGEPVISESYVIRDGQSISYIIKPYKDQGGEIYQPGQEFVANGKRLKFKGVIKSDGTPVFVQIK